MDENSTLTVKRYFKEYYFKYGSRIKAPTEIESREFGYFPFGGGMVRHLSFKEIGNLRALLVKEAPAGVYCSNSLYNDPTFEMHKKGWLKADLIFDIDADLLKLPCKKQHDIWLCKQCGRREFGLRPEICPTCGGNRILEIFWACPICVEGTKRETFKLLDFLQNDFGISDSQIHVSFSGNAGYHILVSGSAFEELDQHGRSEIADYLTATGLIPETFKSTTLAPDDPGWRGRIARYIRN
ncbi:MAG: DNA primase, partial [Thaumarchaeota archaeon]|nr:DNA primase [Nitrososphaerota archaeon]